MKNWFDYFLLHLGMAWSVILYLCVATFIGQIFVAMMPAFKIQATIVVQILAFIPFYLYFPKFVAPKTLQYVGGDAKYYSAMVGAHLPMLFLIFTFLIMYLNLKSSGVQEDIIASIEGLSDPSKFSFSDLSLVSIVLTVVLKILGEAPIFLIGYIDNFILNIVGYLCLILVMMISVEWRRNGLNNKTFHPKTP